MSRLTRRAAIAATTIAAAGALTIPTTAHAGTVPNMFWRTCTAFGCSAFVQSNPPYQASIISQCNTKNWLGQVSSTYYKWGRC